MLYQIAIISNFVVAEKKIAMKELLDEFVVFYFAGWLLINLSVMPGPS